jgi:hypothetical protein
LLLTDSATAHIRAQCAGILTDSFEALKAAWLLRLKIEGSCAGILTDSFEALKAAWLLRLKIEGSCAGILTDSFEALKALYIIIFDIIFRLITTSYHIFDPMIQEI